jgi:nucleotide-binding universal stress UspA family protein
VKRFRNILVGVDLTNADRQAPIALSRPSRQALARAIWLAAHTRGKLTIFSALPVSPFVQDLQQERLSQATDEGVRQANAILDSLVAQATAEGVDARAKFAFGTPWEEICRQQQGDNHDLVVVGTRDLGHVTRVLFGSTAMKLLRHCPCPVWVARPDAYWEHQEILVPSDFSDVSLEALRIAVEGRQLVDSRVHVLHVLQGLVGPPAWYGRVAGQMVEDYVAEQRAQVKKRLHEQLAQAGEHARQHVQVHVVEGSPDEAILKAIDDLKIDLVIMGTAARSGLASMMLGNTTERLISHIRCSLIAVKPQGFQFQSLPVSEVGVRQPIPLPAANRPLQ